MKSIRLKENLALRFTDIGCEIHGPGGIKIKDSEKKFHKTLQHLFDSGIPVSEIDRQDPSTRSLVKLLVKKKLLRLHETDYTRTEIWLSHYVDDARKALQTLAQKRVLIVGCGGTGSIVADHLARAGVREFTLVDGAELDAPDLNRQWTYSSEDIGYQKVDLLAKHLSRHFQARVNSICRFLNETSDLIDLKNQEYDLIVCAADKPRLVIENLLLDLAEFNNTPLLFGAVGIADDFVGEVLDSPEKRQAERSRLQEQASSNMQIKVVQGSLCFTNTLAAAKIGLASYRFLLTR